MAEIEVIDATTTAEYQRGFSQGCYDADIGFVNQCLDRKCRGLPIDSAYWRGYQRGYVTTHYYGKLNAMEEIV